MAEPLAVFWDQEDAMPVISPFSSDESDLSDSEEIRSYDLNNGMPEEPYTSDEDSDDSGGGGGRFSRVFVVNPSYIHSEDVSSGVDCDYYEFDSLEIIDEDDDEVSEEEAAICNTVDDDDDEES